MAQTERVNKMWDWIKSKMPEIETVVGTVAFLIMGGFISLIIITSINSDERKRLVREAEVAPTKASTGQTLPKNQITVYEHGVLCRESGIPANANPYKNTSDAILWLKGWMEAKP